MELPQGLYRTDAQGVERLAMRIGNLRHVLEHDPARATLRMELDGRAVAYLPGRERPLEQQLRDHAAYAERLDTLLMERQDRVAKTIHDEDVSEEELSWRPAWAQRLALGGEKAVCNACYLARFRETYKAGLRHDIRIPERLVLKCRAFEQAFALGHEWLRMFAPPGEPDAMDELLAANDALRNGYYMLRKSEENRRRHYIERFNRLWPSEAISEARFLEGL